MNVHSRHVCAGRSKLRRAHLPERPTYGSLLEAHNGIVGAQLSGRAGDEQIAPERADHNSSGTLRTSTALHHMACLCTGSSTSRQVASTDAQRSCKHQRKEHIDSTSAAILCACDKRTASRDMCNAQQRIRCRVQAQHFRLHDVPKLGDIAHWQLGSWHEGKHDAHGNASQPNSEPAHTSAALICAPEARATFQTPSR